MTLTYGLDATRLPGYSSRGSWTPRQIKWLPGQEVVCPETVIIDGTNSIDGGNTGYTDELRPGWMLAMITSTKKFVPVKRTLTNGAGASATALIVDNAAAFKTSETITIKGPRDIVKVTDSDTAASTGVALYLHMDELGENNFGHLEAVNAGNADSSFTTINGAVVKVEDDDAAATGGVAIYFDEDAAEGSKLLAAVPTGKDAFIFDTAGRAIRIKYHATPSTPGVLLYFDDDGATNTRVLFVSPTNADGRFLTDDVVGIQANITRSSANTVTAIDYTTNTLTITAASWVDGDQVYCDSLAGSETARIVLDGFVKINDAGGTAQDRAIGSSSVPPTPCLIGGFLIDSMLLGDVDAVQADTSSPLFDKIVLDTDYGFTAGS